MAGRRRSPVNSEAIESSMCSYDVKLQIIRRLPFLSAIDEKSIVWASSFFRDRGYEAGQTIYLSRSEATHLYVVAVGAVKLIHRTDAGRDVILDVLGPGEFFGNVSESLQSRHTNSAQALVSTCALVISKREFHSILVEFPAVTLELFDAVSSRLESAQDTIRRLSVDDAEQRVAVALLRLTQKFGRKRQSGLLIELPLSREDLAGMCGANTETTSRIVSRLRRERIVETGRKWISILDQERLSHIASG